MGKIKVSRKKATAEILSTLTNFWERADLINNFGGRIESPETEEFLGKSEKIRTNLKEFGKTLELLDTENFGKYYAKVGKFAEKWDLYNKRYFDNYEPVKVEDLEEELGKHEKTKEKIELVDSFTDEELAVSKFTYKAKFQLLEDYLDDLMVFDETENAINKVLLSFTADDRAAFISTLGTDNKILNRLMAKVNGSEKDEMLAILGEMLITGGFTNGSAVKPVNNKKDDIVEGTYEKGHMYITVSSPQDYGVRDYRTAPKQTFTAEPFDLISMNYDGREITLPAILLAKSWENSLSTPEGIFYNYDKEDVDWDSLTDAEKDEYFAEFVEHYLPEGFLKALGNPIQLLIMACLTIVTAGLFAELEAAFTAAGIAMSVIEGGAAIYGIVKAGEMKAAAKTVHEAKKAAKVMAENIAKLTVNAVDVISAVAGYRRSSNENTNSVRRTPEEILSNAGYTNGKKINDYSAKVKELQKNMSDEELTNIITKQKNSKKGSQEILDNLLEKYNTEKIDGLYICDGKVDGKIPKDVYIEYRKKSVHNPTSDTMTLGKYDVLRNEEGKAVKDADGNAIRLPTNYIVRAGDTTYFDLGADWNTLTKDYWLDKRGRQMFKMYNRPALDDAINSGKTLRFSHDPRLYPNTALGWEWDYIKKKKNIAVDEIEEILEEKDDFWYVH